MDQSSQGCELWCNVAFYIKRCLPTQDALVSAGEVWGHDHSTTFSNFADTVQLHKHKNSTGLKTELLWTQTAETAAGIIFFPSCSFFPMETLKDACLWSDAEGQQQWRNWDLFFPYTSLCRDPLWCRTVTLEGARHGGSQSHSSMGAEPPLSSVSAGSQQDRHQSPGAGRVEKGTMLASVMLLLCLQQSVALLIIRWGWLQALSIPAARDIQRNLLPCLPNENLGFRALT